MIQNIPRTIMEQVSEEVEKIKPYKNSWQRVFGLLSTRALLEGGPSRELRTAQLADMCGVSQATMFKTFLPPIGDSMVTEGCRLLESEFYGERNRALVQAAVNLITVNKPYDFNDSLTQWLGYYFSIANPSELQIAVARKHRSRITSLADQHSSAVTTGIQLLAAPKQTPVPDDTGRKLLPSLMTYDKLLLNNAGTNEDYVIDSVTQTIKANLE